MSIKNNNALRISISNTKYYRVYKMIKLTSFKLNAHDAYVVHKKELNSLQFPISHIIRNNLFYEIRK